MSTPSESEILDLIDRKEFRKRQKEFRAKHEEHYAQVMKIEREKKL
jgi:hypothetical protein